MEAMSLCGSSRAVRWGGEAPCGQMHYVCFWLQPFPNALWDTQGSSLSSFPPISVRHAMNWKLFSTLFLVLPLSGKLWFRYSYLTSSCPKWRDMCKLRGESSTVFIKVLFLQTHWGILCHQQKHNGDILIEFINVLGTVLQLVDQRLKKC